MIELTVSGDLSPIIQQLDRWRTLDLTPLADEVKAILVEENILAREAGLDRSGSPLAPLRGGRGLTPSESRRRGGDGPPLAPRGSASRVVSAFEVEVLPLADGAVLVRGSWPGFPELEFHVRGGGRLPVRDPAGVTPQAAGRIGEAVARFLAAAFGAT